jgi:hypothetical protein
LSRRSHQRGAVSRGLIFLGICVAGLATVAGYVYYAKVREANIVAASERAASPQPGAAQSAKVGSGAYSPKRVFYRYNGLGPHNGRIAFVSPESRGEPQFIDRLSCEVAYVAGGQGICLGAKRGVITTYSARLFDAASFETHAQFALNGVPSRTRVSVDGKLAAFTVFLSGHGYSSVDFSTQTMIVDVASGATVLDLDTLTVLRDGKAFKEPDFNFWGVTFTPDSREFYATLSTGGKHFLLRANIEARTARIVHENVECPSLSPDGTRVAYKKRFRAGDRVVWELHVLDLATGKETPLQEKRSVDDQLEWLDSGHVLYSVPGTEDDSSGSTNVWMIAADGKTGPSVYLRTAYSPSAVR